MVDLPQGGAFNTGPATTQFEGGISVEIKNLDKFQKAVEDATKQTRDLRVAFGLIARNQFKFQRQIFQVGAGPGKYPDLSTRPWFDKYNTKKFWPGGYKQQKRETKGFIYPILLREGRLARSLLQPGGENVLNINRDSMEYGSSVPYAKTHQFGAVNRDGHTIPRRPFLFIDSQRIRSWSNILKAHLTKPFSEPR